MGGGGGNSQAINGCQIQTCGGYIITKWIQINFNCKNFYLLFNCYQLIILLNKSNVGNFDDDVSFIRFYSRESKPVRENELFI